MGTLLRRIVHLWNRSRHAEELSEELQFHEALKREELSSSEPGEMLEAASRRALGNTFLMRELASEVWLWRWLADVVQDIRFAGRMLCSQPLVTLAAVVSLALGIGATTTIFSLLNAVLGQLPVERAERLVALGTSQRGLPLVVGPMGYEGLTFAEYVDLRAALGPDLNLAAYEEAHVTLSDPARGAVRVDGTYVSWGWLRVLSGGRPLLGRGFQPADDVPGAPAVVLLSYELWQRRYGADRRVVGSRARVNGIPATIVGVLPAGLRFPENGELWLPLNQLSGLSSDSRSLSAFGRLQSSLPPAAAEVVLRGRASSLLPPDRVLRLMPFRERYIPPQIDRVFLAMTGAAWLLLVLACANVTVLLLSQAIFRVRELAVRASIGATRARLIRQLLVEGSVIAGMAATAAVGVAVWGVRTFSVVVIQIDPPPYWVHFNVAVGTLGFALLISAITVFGFSLVPALLITGANTSEALKQGARSASTCGLRPGRWMGALVIGEVLLTVVLLSAASSVLRAFVAQYRGDRGVDGANVFTMRVDFGDEHDMSRDLERRRTIEDGLMSLQNPAAFADRLPLMGEADKQYQIEGVPHSRQESRAELMRVGPRYFDALGVPLLLGRAFRAEDETAAERVAIVNADLALRVGWRNTLGSRIWVGDGPWRTIVGVSRTAPLKNGSSPVVYVPFASTSAETAVILARRTPNFPDVVAAVRELVRRSDPDIPVWDVHTLDEWYAFLQWPERVFGTVFGIFGLVALVLAATGIYSVTSQAVTTRRREIGIRLALGASGPRLCWLLLWRTTTLVCVGVSLGMFGAAFTDRLPWGISNGPGALASIGGLLLLAAMIASLAPVAHALRAEAVDVLRAE